MLSHHLERVGAPAARVLGVGEHRVHEHHTEDSVGVRDRDLKHERGMEASAEQRQRLAAARVGNRYNVCHGSTAEFGSGGGE